MGFTSDQMRAYGRECRATDPRIAALEEKVEQLREAVQDGIEALERHASMCCEDSLPQETVDALAKLRKADSPIVEPHARVAALEASIKQEADSRAMFVARLRNELENNGRPSLAIDEVLALLNDCDYCAALAAREGGA